MKLQFKFQLFILIIFVIVINISLLKVILNNGFTTEEWLLLFDYKTIRTGTNFLDKIYAIISQRGIYYATYIIYIGILETLFKDHYESYQLVNIFFKILASLSVFPLVFIVFKRRTLAYLTTILYSMSYSSAGALQFIVKGIDYLAIFFMNIFLISYYFSLTTKRKLFLLTTSSLLFMCFILSPIRMYPLLIFITLFEIIIWTKRRGLSGLIIAFLRLLFILCPYLLISLFMMLTFPKFTTGYASSPLTLFKFIIDGNYHLFLSPIAGFGYTFLTNDFWPIFGELRFDRFLNYLSFLVKGPFIIYSILAIFLGFLITKKSFAFIIKIIFLNIIFEILSYFLITHVRFIDGLNAKEFYSISTYAIFLGFFILSIAAVSFSLWLKDRKNNTMLKPLFVGPIFANLFLWGTWFIIGTNLTFKEGIHWYLIVAPLGTSLFLAGLIEIGLYKIGKSNFDSYTKDLLVVNVFLFLITIYLISGREINSTFGNLSNLGYKASDQERITKELMGNIPKTAFETPLLFYLEIDKNQKVSDTFYMNALSLMVGFEDKILLRDFEINNGCIAMLHEKNKLEESLVSEEGVKGFLVDSLCVHDHLAVERIKIFYKPEYLYAFKLRNKHLINIKEELLNELNY